MAESNFSYSGALEDPLLVEITQRIVEILHDFGRVATFEELKDVLYNEIFVEDMQNFKYHKRGGELKDFIGSQMILFYVLEIDNITYVALSRYATYVYPRLATATVPHTDPDMIRLITDHEILSMPTGFPPARDDVRILEKEYVKSILTVMEILETLFKSFKKGRSRVTIDKVVSECSNLSSSARAVLDFCDSNDTASALKRFLFLFQRTFTVRDDVILINRLLYQAMRATLEMDLIWSYCSLCITDGIIRVPALTEAMKKFSNRVGFRRITHINRTSIDALIHDLPEIFLNPGDGKILLLDPCFNVTTEFLKKALLFFEDYVKNNGPFPYTECCNIMMLHDPELYSLLNQQCFINVASFLAVTSTEFAFAKGNFDRSSRYTYRCYVEIVPPDVPTDLLVVNHIPSPRFRKVLGRVRNAGLKGLIIEVLPSQSYRISANATTLIFAFGRTDVTRFCGLVTNFSCHVATNDLVEFTFRYYDDIYPERPCYLEVLEILRLVNENELLMSYGNDSVRRSGSAIATPPPSYSSTMDSKMASESNISGKCVKCGKKARKKKRTRYELLLCPQCRSFSDENFDRYMEDGTKSTDSSGKYKEKTETVTSDYNPTRLRRSDIDAPAPDPLAERVNSFVDIISKLVLLNSNANNQSSAVNTSNLTARIVSLDNNASRSAATDRATKSIEQRQPTAYNQQNPSPSRNTSTNSAKCQRNHSYGKSIDETWDKLLPTILDAISGVPYVTPEMATSDNLTLEEINDFIKRMTPPHFFHTFLPSFATKKYAVPKNDSDPTVDDNSNSVSNDEQSSEEAMVQNPIVAMTHNRLVLRPFQLHPFSLAPVSAATSSQSSAREGLPSIVVTPPAEELQPSNQNLNNDSSDNLASASTSGALQRASNQDTPSTNSPEARCTAASGAIPKGVRSSSKSKKHKKKKSGKLESKSNTEKIDITKEAHQSIKPDLELQGAHSETPVAVLEAPLATLRSSMQELMEFRLELLSDIAASNSSNNRREITDFQRMVRNGGYDKYFVINVVCLAAHRKCLLAQKVEPTLVFACRVPNVIEGIMAFEFLFQIVNSVEELLEELQRPITGIIMQVVQEYPYTGDARKPVYIKFLHGGDSSSKVSTEESNVPLVGETSSATTDSISAAAQAQPSTNSAYLLPLQTIRCNTDMLRRAYAEAMSMSSRPNQSRTRSDPADNRVRSDPANIPMRSDQVLPGRRTSRSRNFRTIYLEAEGQASTSTSRASWRPSEEPCHQGGDIPVESLEDRLAGK